MATEGTEAPKVQIPEPQVPNGGSPTSIQQTPVDSSSQQFSTPPSGVNEHHSNTTNNANLTSSPSVRGAERLSHEGNAERFQKADSALDYDDKRKIGLAEGRDAKHLAKILEVEAKNDAEALKTALKDAEKANKLSRKAEKSLHQANSRLEKAITNQHSLAKKLERLKSEYENAERTREQMNNELELKKKHKAEIDTMVDERMDRIQKLQNGKAILDRERTVQRRNTVNPKK